jgi:outer membrane protein assembly factor BamB
MAGDWPQWRYDAGRTACSSEVVAAPLCLQWVRELPAPRPAWPASQTKLRFDASYEPIAAGGLLIVGSSADDSVAAYHAATGALAWRFHTDGPVRFAPVAYKSNIWAASDDGYLYCLDLPTGKLLWKLRGGLDDRKVVGNGRLVSMWPARGGPVVHDGTLYFAAGIWPFMGTFIHAVDPDTREVCWCNSASGSTWTIQQHYAPAFAGVAPQGYLAAGGDTLLVSGGRTVPAAFDARTGGFKYFNVSSREVSNSSGGYDVAVTGEFYFNSGQMHRIANDSLAAVVSASVYGTGEVYGLDKGELFAASFKIREVEYTDTRGKKAKKGVAPTIWKHKLPQPLKRLFMRAGNCLYASTTGGEVVAIDLARPEQFAWQAKIDGEPWTMLAADGRLFVVTLEGRIYCFAGQAVAQPRRYALGRTPSPVNSPAGAGMPGTAGKDAVTLTGVKSGFAVVLGADAALVDGLVANSDLEVIVLDPNAGKVASLRAHLGERYGLRVAALAASLPEAKLPPYLASLVVAAGDQAAHEPAIREAYRVLRPYGGTACFRASEDLTARLKRLVAAGEMPGAEVAVKDGWVMLKRAGALSGSGDWTHQYADAGNTVVSPDKLVKAPLGVLWFGGPTNDEILPRHGHGPSPQVVGGRLFIEGRNLLRAVDVYTGKLLWDRQIKDLGRFYDFTGHQSGANEIGSNYVSTADGVYVITPQSCMKLDPATGRTTMEFRLPADLGNKAKWGFITAWDKYLIAAAAPVQDGNVPNYSSASQALLVMDRQGGQLLWRRRAAQSFRHNTIIAGNGRIFCIDGISAAKRDAAKRRGEKQDEKASAVYALDAATGKVLWQVDKDVFGTWLGYSAEHDVLLQAGSSSADRAADEAPKGMIVYRAADGQVLWKDLALAYNGPCMLRHDTIITNSRPYGSGFALDLMTGRRRTWADPLTGKLVEWRYSRMYGCNTAIASENLITFRSAAAGYVDLTSGPGTGNLGGFKSGCTSNLIPADGVLSAPDYTRTCTCSYQNQSSLAMVHMPDVEQWTFLSIGKAAGPSAGRVERIGVNFGSPGDRQAGRTRWLEFPAIGGPSPAMGVKVDGGRTYCHHSGLFAGDELTWVGASGYEGLRKAAVTLDPAPGAAARKFTVRLVFAEPDAKAAPGGRVFDVAVQGRRALEGFDVAKAAGGPRKVVIREIKGVEVAGTLTVELKPVKGETILCGLEAVAE